MINTNRETQAAVNAIGRELQKTTRLAQLPMSPEMQEYVEWQLRRFKAQDRSRHIVSSL